jgi:pSer/pThr/pTyr-binding forkhead associated (FHA) protein
MSNKYFIERLSSPSEKINLKRGSNIIGRLKNVKSPYTSKVHCEIIVNSNNIKIKDLNSVNGTFVNNQKINYVEREISPGCVIGFGAFFKNEESKTDSDIYVGVLKESSLPDDITILESSSSEEEEEINNQHLRNLIKELNQKVQRLQKEKECAVCFVEDRDILCEPCNHVSVCSVCVIQLQNCPICRGQIEKTKKVYHS